MNISRDISEEVIALSRTYPVVTIIGPRQSGKTTLAKMLFPQKPYITLENPDDRAFAESDPRSFFAQFKDGAILDEIQRVPALISYIQGIVDKSDICGMFILTGSNQFALQDKVSQSLAGRTAILKLLPFSLNELKDITSNFSVDEYLYHGAYPRIFKSNINPTKFYRDYIATYLERDVKTMANVKDLRKFRLFLKLCAGRIGQIFNSHNVANEVGVSHTTIHTWLSALETSFIIVMLSPYYENFGKRVIKSPKLYFTDVGLASYLLEINQMQQISRDPLRGNLFENFVIMEAMKYQMNRGGEANFYFYRDSNGHEVDLLYRNGASLVPVEIKSSATFNSSLLKGLEKFMSMEQAHANQGFLIYAGKVEQQVRNVQVVNFRNIESIFSARKDTDSAQL